MEDFEDKVSGFLDYGEGPPPPFTAESIIGGARRRKARHRAAVAGSSLAVLAVAAGAVTMSGGYSGKNAVVGPGVVAETTTRAAATPTPTPSARPSLNSAEVAELKALGTLTPVASGTFDGHAWAIMGKEVKSGMAFQQSMPGYTGADDPSMPADPQVVLVDFQDGAPGGYAIMDPTSAYDPTLPLNMAATGNGRKGGPDSAILEGPVDPRIDHYELYYKDHTDTLRVVHIGGAAVAAFLVTPGDLVQKVTAYDAAGNVIGPVEDPEPFSAQSTVFMAEQFAASPPPSGFSSSPMLATSTSTPQK
jgi:hypothetical protein